MDSTSATATLALAMGLGAILWLASHRLRIPALVPLMVAGALLGRGGLGLIDASLLGEGFSALITLSVAMLVFEGSLHLDAHTLGHAPRAVRGLLTVGAAVTWVGVAAAGVWVLGMPVRFAVVLGAILIVTGPTVIQPLLQRVRLTPRLHAVLLSEGILIDPIGVVATVVTLDVVLVTLGGQEGLSTLHVAMEYAYPLLVGTIAGVVCGLAARAALARSIGFGHEGDRQSSLVAIAACVIATGASEVVRHESGIVAAAVCGLIIARSLKRQLQPARRAAESVAAVLVGLLFMLVGSTIDAAALFAGLSWRDAAFVGVLMLAVRPVSVMLSTWGSKMDLRERVYIALMAPRGIVAISAAALAATAIGNTSTAQESARAVGAEIQDAVLIVVAATVIWAGVAGGPLAWALGVLGPKGGGVIIAGANLLGREIAAALASAEIPSRLVDTNAANCAAASREGQDVRIGDSTDFDWMAVEVIAPEHGHLLALTGNADVDRVVARWGMSAFGENRSATIGGAADGLASTGGNGQNDTRPARAESPRSVQQLLDLLEAGRLVMGEAASPAALEVPIIGLKGGRINALAGGDFSGSEKVIGLRATDSGNAA